jgi:parallel beta-helix repeat protein
MTPLSEAKSKKIACTATKGINAFIAKAKPGDIFLVSGTCNENVDVPSHINGITIDGEGSTTINGTDPTGGAIQVRGKDVTLKNLVVTGPATGIQVHRGGTSRIEGVTVNGVGANAIIVQGSSFVRIINSTIQNSGSNGIVVTENSSARIGFLTNNDTVASPNTITGNVRGIIVSESSSAVITGNDISNNTEDGIFVDAVSFGDIASNTINNNGAHSINFGRNSGVRLGRDSGTDIFDLPNSTTVNNAGFGVRCFINSFADGRLGTLNGASGQTDFPAGCINSTMP